MPTPTRPRVAAPTPAFGGTLGVIALAFGIGIAGAFMLDFNKRDVVIQSNGARSSKIPQVSKSPQNYARYAR